MARPRKTSSKPPPNVVRDPNLPDCDMPGCELGGEYKAPFSPQELNKYRWFCLDHVRDYNASWDYFTGMHASQIEDFMKDAMLGHRPTWKINYQNTNEQKLEQALHEMLTGQRHSFERHQKQRARAMMMTDEEHKALAVLNLEGEVTLQDIKKQYKMLVKKHHPDMNRGDKRAEDRFKRVTEAYQDLMKLLQKRAESS
ncbi:MAG: J domain-containing protein [Alphaproteobacteria bacterium]|nr:J domain-containing protein [Alphaproteobacteria bacterium]